MAVLTHALIILVAVLHIYFLILEMFFWTRPLGLKAFRRTLLQAQDSAVLAANQGLYNGFLAAGLIWGELHTNMEFAWQIKIYFLICVVIAGLMGGITANKKIFFIQALPAALALALLLIKT